MNQILVLTRRRPEAAGNNTGHDEVKKNALGIETLGVPNHDGACSTLSRSRSLWNCAGLAEKAHTYVQQGVVLSFESENTIEIKIA